MLPNPRHHLKIYGRRLSLLERKLNKIKMKRLAQAGHMAHKNNRILKKIFNTKPRVRSVGRPKLRWENRVNQDMETLGVKN